MLSSKRNGFTLLEILLVVAAIGILAGIVILAINPGKQLGDTRNAQRKVDVETILNAVYQYSIDNNGQLPANITEATTTICRTGIANETCTGNTLIDLAALTNSTKYLVSIPIDPSATGTYSTGYSIVKTAQGRITVIAPNAESGASISVSK